MRPPRLNPNRENRACGKRSSSWGDQRPQVFAAELQLVGRPFGVTAAVVEQVDGHDGVLLTEQGSKSRKSSALLSNP